MAVEIILRDDITNYEAHPVFGLTWRGGVTVAICIVVAFILFNVIRALGFDYQVAGIAIMVADALIAGVGFVKIKGMRIERYLRYALGDLMTPARVEHETPVVVGALDAAHANMLEEMKSEQKKAARSESESDR